MFPANSALEFAEEADDAFQILQDSRTSEERILALDKAIAVFNHIEEIEHDYEIDRGLGEMLCWRLQSVLLNSFMSSSSSSSLVSFILYFKALQVSNFSCARA